MNYRELREVLSDLTEEQLSCDVTVELGLTDECFEADFKICDEEHDILDEDHPVIYLDGV